MQLNILSILIMLCGLLLLALAVFAWQRRAINGASEFAAFMFFATVYVFGYSLELASPDLATMLFWNKIQYIGIYLFPPLFFIFILRYTGKGHWLTPHNTIALLVIPALLLGAKFADGQFHWIYRTVTVDRSGPFALLAFTRGPLYTFGAILNALWVLAGMCMLWRKRKVASALYRNQATLMALSALGPLLVYILYMSGLQPFPALRNLDLNCFVFTFWGAGISWTMFRYRLFDLTPIAREALIEKLNDGLLVVDVQHRIVDTNPAAVKLFGWARAPIGLPVDRQVNDWIAAVHSRENCPAATIEAQIDAAGQERFFEADVSALKDRRGECIGYLILLHEITRRKLVERELHELTLTDDLTGLNNRRGFTMLANQYLQMAQRMDLPAILAYIDLDDLKRINDRSGHPAGDQALVDTAAILKNTFRSADILARIGGDEFVVLSIQPAEQSVERMIERLNENLAAHNDQVARPFVLAFSAGAAAFDPAAPASLDALLQAADQAMYAHKQEKKSTRQAAV